MKKNRTGVKRKPATSAGAKMILAERKRQLEQEGWDPAHDDEHTQLELPCAALAYLAAACGRERHGERSGLREGRVYQRIEARNTVIFSDVWPANWDEKWDKRQSHPRLKSLAIAGALIAAEIDRLLRAAER